jgi:hypothetical protein
MKYITTLIIKFQEVIWFPSLGIGYLPRDTKDRIEAVTMPSYPAFISWILKVLISKVKSSHPPHIKHPPPPPSLYSKAPTDLTPLPSLCTFTKQFDS